MSPITFGEGNSSEWPMDGVPSAQKAIEMGEESVKLGVCGELAVMRSEMSQVPLTCRDFFHRVFLIGRRFKRRDVRVELCIEIPCRVCPQCRSSRYW